MKSSQPLRSHVPTCLVARLFSDARCPGKAAVLVTAAALLLELSASAATVVWNWAGADRNWSTVLNWTGGIPEAANPVIFGNTDAQTGTTPVNTVDANTTVSSLSYTNSSSGSATSYRTRRWPAGGR